METNLVETNSVETNSVETISVELTQIMTDYDRLQHITTDYDRLWKIMNDQNIIRIYLFSTCFLHCYTSVIKFLEDPIIFHFLFGKN